MRYDNPYTELGIIDPVSLALVGEIASSLGPFISKLGVTNDNGVIAARDKIAQYVTQVLGDRDAAYKQLYEGYQLGHSDINNVGTSSYYAKVMTRLNNAVLNYIAKHAAESSTIFAEEISPADTLRRYEEQVKAGKPLDHAFWIAFTGRKDPYDIRTGNALPKTSTSSGSSFTFNDAGDILTATGQLLKRGTPEYEAAIKNNPTVQAGFFDNPQNIMIAMVGGIALLSAGAYFYNKSQSSKK